MKFGVGRSGLIIVLAAWTSFSLLLVQGMLQASEQSAAAQQTFDQPWQPAAYVEFEEAETKFVVPSWKRLDDDKIWAYVWKGHGLDSEFTPELTDINDVEIGDWVEDKRLHPLAAPNLTKFTQAAKAAGHPVIVTSAYRSYAEQQKTKSEMTLTNGQVYSDEFVAEPGHSEHQLGLAVDFSSYTAACQENFANCQLKTTDAKWLADHAAEYGFILRYPEGKSIITGVQPESWHFRYVGKEMAELVKTTGLTFDEIYKILIDNRK